MIDNKTKNIGRIPEVTEIEIIEAGKKLSAINKNVTGSALRKVLGKGDFKRLLRVWTEYEVSEDSKNESATELTSEVKQAINDATSTLSQTFESLVKDIYNKANSGAQQHIYSAINIAESRQKKADDEMHDALGIIEDLEQTVSTLEESLGISEEAAEELLLTNTELEAVLEKLTHKVKEQYKLIEVASSEYEEVTKSTALKEDHIETLAESNTDLKADKSSLQKEVEDLRLELFKRTQEHDQQIKNTLKKLEDRFDSAA
jgi:chromosome segregation ATPase